MRVRSPTAVGVHLSHVGVRVVIRVRVRVLTPCLGYRQLRVPVGVAKVMRSMGMPCCHWRQRRLGMSVVF